MQPPPVLLPTLQPPQYVGTPTGRGRGAAVGFATRGNFYTANDVQPRAVVVDGRITFVGRIPDALRRAPPGARRLDLHGATVVLRRGDGHALVVNSVALQRAGIDRNTLRSALFSRTAGALEVGGRRAVQLGADTTSEIAGNRFHRVDPRYSDSSGSRGLWVNEPETLFPVLTAALRRGIPVEPGG